MKICTTAPNLRHDGQSINLITTDGIRQTLIFRGGRPFTFEVKAKNSEQIREMLICSERNGITKRMEAFYDAKKDVWLSTGYFDPANTSYVPGDIFIEFAGLKEQEPIDVNAQISQEDIDSYRESLSPEWKDAATELLVNTENRKEARIILANEEKTEITLSSETYPLPEGMTEAQLLAEGYFKIPTTDDSAVYVKWDGILQSPAKSKSLPISAHGEDVNGPALALSAAGIAFGWGMNKIFDG